MYDDECLESERTITPTRSMHRILDPKCEKADLNKFMNNQCQHLTDLERHRLLHILNKFEDLFGGRLGMWNTTSVNLELKDEAKPV